MVKEQSLFSRKMRFYDHVDKRIATEYDLVKEGIGNGRINTSDIYWFAKRNLGLGDRTVKDYLTDLEERGYITIISDKEMAIVMKKKEEKEIKEIKEAMKNGDV